MKFGLILLIFLTFFRPLIPLLDYGLNYKYFSTVLCINKNKPETHCNGKCQLAKEIADKAAQDSQENTTSNSIKFVDVFIIIDKLDFSINKIQISPVTNFYHYIDLYSIIYQTSIFKPPVLSR
ncbi:hypothetical protein O2K51_14325 [Apibacter raozihei]|uniref:hypothetical protein n=1 Tax=Apibacter raozihei TaxID=2500547 RepID=UPI000FE30E20|nr:hypothetical protein [Apibacter raozihei]